MITKKLLILILALGMASVADAGLTISVSTTGPHETGGTHFDPGLTFGPLTPNQTIWIGVNSANLPIPGHFDSILWIREETPNTGFDPDGQWTGNEYVYQWPDGPALPPVGPPLPNGAFNTYMGYLAGFGDWWAFSNTAPVLMPVLDGLHTDYEYQCVGDVGTDGGTVVIDLIDAYTGLTTDTLTITQIPEPATLLLLGLGAVMLRRKRPKIFDESLTHF